jgi:membrane associated rhomboid family serine protease
LLLGYWFLIQFVAGFAMLSIQTATAGGVAWWAHIGGFVCGLLLALVLPPQHRGPVVEIVS